VTLYRIGWRHTYEPFAVLKSSPTAWPDFPSSKRLSLLAYRLRRSPPILKQICNLRQQARMRQRRLSPPVPLTAHSGAAVRVAVVSD